MNNHEDDELGQLIKTHASHYKAPQSLRNRIGAAVAEMQHAEDGHWIKRWLSWPQLAGMGVTFASGVVISVVVMMFYGEYGQ